MISVKQFKKKNQQPNFYKTENRETFMNHINERQPQVPD